MIARQSSSGKDTAGEDMSGMVRRVARAAAGRDTGKEDGDGAVESRASTPPRFLLVPAIDVLGGRVVRLRYGDPATATVYGIDAAAAASRWAGEGADLLHVVDLDAALQRRDESASAIGDALAAARAAGVPCEVAGGIRAAPDAAAWLRAGAARVVLGTALLMDRDMASLLVSQHGSDRIVAAVDVRDGVAVGEGWRSGGASMPLEVLVGRLVDAGVTRLEVTAIDRDGAMGGPDLQLLGRVRALAPGVKLIASAGVRGSGDLVALRDLGCDGAILGRALYEDALTLVEARAALASA
jgi:phosphoribosylformimino-5-aminoimidazole carboxamide ribotide isomerase